MVTDVAGHFVSVSVVHPMSMQSIQRVSGSMGCSVAPQHWQVSVSPIAVSVAFASRIRFDSELFACHVVVVRLAIVRSCGANAAEPVRVYGNPFILFCPRDSEPGEHLEIEFSDAVRVAPILNSELAILAGFRVPRNSNVDVCMPAKVDDCVPGRDDHSVLCDCVVCHVSSVSQIKRFAPMTYPQIYPQPVDELWKTIHRVIHSLWRNVDNPVDNFFDAGSSPLPRRKISI